MSSYLEYLLFIGIIVCLWGAWRLRINSLDDLNQYRRSDDFKDAFGGIARALLFAALLGALVLLIGCSGTYMNDASVYAGLDLTDDLSPMCTPDSTDDRSTSNIGLRVNAYESNDGRFRANGKYTHHSCAYGHDAEGYDAVGIELEYTFWER